MFPEALPLVVFTLSVPVVIPVVLNVLYSLATRAFRADGRQTS